MSDDGSGPIPVDHPVLAVIAPPRLPAFRTRLGIGADEPITANFTGWSKLVLLTADLAVLIPRDATQQDALQREIDALARLAPLRILSIPEVLDVIEDPAISADRLVVCRRLPGVPLADIIESVPADQLADLFEDLGGRIARWHATPHDRVEGLRRRDGLTAVVDFAATLDLPPAERRWSDTAAALAAELDPVLVHGDLHEGQLLVAADPPHHLTGILDWQTVRIDHPFVDVDLGEWGTAIWRAHRRSFPELRRRAWSAYAAERGLDPAVGAAFEWFHACNHARRLAGDATFPVAHPPEVIGTPADARAAITAALRTLADLVP